MKSFQTCVTELKNILDKGKTGTDVRSDLDAFFCEEFTQHFSELLKKSDSPANSIEVKYQFYKLLSPAFAHYQKRDGGRMHDDRTKVNNLCKKLGEPLIKMIRPYEQSLIAEQKKKNEALRKQEDQLKQSVYAVFQSLGSFNLQNYQANPQSDIDTLIVRTALSSPQHKILGIESGGHSTIECRKKDGTSLFFGFYVHEAAEKPTLMAKIAKMLGVPSPDKKVVRFVDLEKDHLKNLYEEIHIPCDGVLNIDLAMDYLVENKFSAFDPTSGAPMREDYQLYSQNCSTFVKNALMKAQGANPLLPYDGATILGLDTPMAVRAYAQRLRDTVLFEQEKMIRQANPVVDDKAHVIQAIMALENLNMTDATDRDKLLVDQLVHRLIAVVNFPVGMPFLYQDMQALMSRIQELKPESSHLETIHSILLTASGALSPYRQQVDLIIIKEHIANAINPTKSTLDSLNTASQMLGFIDKWLSEHDIKRELAAFNKLESIRGMLYEQMYFQRNAKSQNGLIKDINRWILPNMLFEEVQPPMSSLVEIAIEALSIKSSEPFHQREDETKRALRIMLKDSELALPAKLLAVEQTISAHAPWWVRWLPSWALFAESRDSQAGYVQLKNQAQLLCVMDALVKGKITTTDWKGHLDKFEDWLPVDKVKSWKDFIDKSSYSIISTGLGIQSQVVAENSKKQELASLHAVETSSIIASADLYSDSDSASDLDLDLDPNSDPEDNRPREYDCK